jgi:hypothetical protein
MPSAKCVAECLLLGTRQRASLPSAALRKEIFLKNIFFAECRGSEHSANNFSKKNSLLSAMQRDTWQSF